VRNSGAQAPVALKRGSRIVIPTSGDAYVNTAEIHKTK
jgi:hypothetical protein